MLHRDQVRCMAKPGRFLAVRCGRRWGKTALCLALAGSGALRGQTIGWFAPEYKRLSESYNDASLALDPVKSGSSKTEGVIRLVTGGKIDFWSLEDENAGRGRRYHLAIIDEAAFTRPRIMRQTWERAIRPTLVDFRGAAVACSNTNGIDPDNFFYAICTDPKLQFVEYHAPSRNNPYLPRDEVASFQVDNAPLVYQQEYLAEFIDWSGAAFFLRDNLLVDGQGVDLPRVCEAVFATIDTALKSGREHDGTAVTYFAVMAPRADGRRWVVVLDWDISQIDGALLEGWLPTVFARLEELSRMCLARMGSAGAFIEDKGSGTVLLQQSRLRDWQANEIPSRLTALGKDERAVSVSGYVHRGQVKLSKHAHDKVTIYKGTSRNHLEGQVIGYRVGQKQSTALPPEDDLLDTFCYGIACGLGDEDGF